MEEKELMILLLKILLKDNIINEDTFNIAIKKVEERKDGK